MKTPHLPHSEKSALSLLSHDPSELGRHDWNESLFFTHAHQLIFRAIQESATDGLPTDLISVTARLAASGHLDDAGGPATVSEVLLTYGLPVKNLLTEVFSQLVKAQAHRDTLTAIREAEPEISNMSCDLGGFAGHIAQLANPAVGSSRQTVSEIAISILDEIESREIPERFAFGLPPLDNRLDGGLGRGEMAVVAGGTGSGKSVLLCMAALQAALAGKRVLFFTLEMPARDVFKRLTSNHSGFPIPKAKDNPTKRHVDAFTRALDSLSTLPLTIIDDARSLAQIEAAGMTAQADLLVVDYLQLVETPKADNRELGISEVARRLKGISSRKIAVLTASQLNDDGRLRESRAIGHHSDIVLSIEDNGIKCSKNRNGADGWQVNAELDGRISRFAQ